MRSAIRWMLALVIANCFFIALASRIVISYEYDSRGICVGATAHLEEDSTRIGKAKLEDLVKGKHYRVRLWHYSRSGAVVYEAVAKYSIYGGTKLSEEKVRGQKQLEIFSTWPSG